MDNSTALQMEKFKTLDQLLPARGPNVYNSGIKDNQKAFVLYGPEASDQPTLIITDPIYDEDGNTINPGYYELMLSFDKQTLFLTQSQKIIATMPVFQLEEDKNQEPVAQPMNNKSQRKFNKEQKKKEKKDKKLKAQGKMPTQPGIYNEASIEYDVSGDYYLVKYERGRIRAWGALKLQ